MWNIKITALNKEDGIITTGLLLNRNLKIPLLFTDFLYQSVNNFHWLYITNKKQSKFTFASVSFVDHQYSGLHFNTAFTLYDLDGILCAR